MAGYNAAKMALPRDVPYNPWGRLFFLYLPATLVMGQFFLNWAPLHAYLLDQGVYANLCPSDDPSCPAREAKIASLSCVADSATFMFAFVGGLVRMRFGSTWTVFLGSILLSCAYTLMYLSTDAKPMFYNAFLLWGASAEFLCLGLMNIQYCFPTMQSTVMTLIGSTRSSAGLLGLLIHDIPIKQLTGYMSEITIITGCLAFLWMVRDFEDEKKSPMSQGWEDDSSERKLTTQFMENGYEDISDIVDHNVYIHDQQHGSPYVDGGHGRELSYTFDKGTKWVLAAFLVYYTTFIPCFNFIEASLPILYKESPRMIRLVSYAQPLSFLTCPLLGLLADTLHPKYVLIVEVVSALLVMLLASGVLPTSEYLEALQFVSIMTFFACPSSQAYLFCCKVIKDKKYHGIAVGLTFLVSGLAGFLTESAQVDCLENGGITFMSCTIACLISITLTILLTTMYIFRI